MVSDAFRRTNLETAGFGVLMDIGVVSVPAISTVLVVGM